MPMIWWELQLATDPMRTTIGYWSDENYNCIKGDTSLNKQKPMCVQTGEGSDVVVKNNPNMLTHERW